MSTILKRSPRVSVERLCTHCEDDRELDDKTQQRMKDRRPIDFFLPLLSTSESIASTDGTVAYVGRKELLVQKHDTHCLCHREVSFPVQTMVDKALLYHVVRC